MPILYAKLRKTLFLKTKATVIIVTIIVDE